MRQSLARWRLASAHTIERARGFCECLCPTGWASEVESYAGYGLKYRGARGQPLTRGPEADETKTMTVAWPHHPCVPLSKRRQHHLARSTCAAAPNVNSFADALCSVFTQGQGLMALMQPIICCVRAQSAREFVTVTLPR